MTAAACNLFGSLSPEQFRTMQSTGFSAHDIATFYFSLSIALVVIWAAVGLLIFWRRSDDWLALLVALALVLFNVSQQGEPPTALALASPAWTLPVEVLSFVSQASFGVFLFLFPNGRFAPRWTRWFALVFLIQAALAVFPPANSPLGETNVPALDGLLFASATMVGLYSQIYRYRRVSSPVQRQQIKWAVFGIAITLVLTILLGASNAFPTLNQSGAAYLVIENLFPLALLPIPLSIGIAILRYRLWDIDTIINKALVYGLLTALLGALYAGLIIGLQSLAGAITGQESQPVVIVISTLAIATLVLPVRRRIQSMIDRRFYRRKYDAQKTLAAFSASLRNEVDLAHLREQVLVVVEETMQPTQVSLWLREPDHDHPNDQAYRLEPQSQVSTKPNLD